MPFVLVDTPQGQTAINPDEVFCIVPEPQTPAADCEIQFDVRQVVALHTADQAAGMLGGNLRRLEAASLDFDHVWVNPRRVTNVTPHPQVGGVCFVVGGARKIAVKGELQTVIAAM